METFFSLLTPGRPNGRRRSSLTLLGVHHVHVERRIGHDEVALADEVVLVFVVGDGLADVALQAVDGEVHLGEADGGRGLLLTVEGDAMAGVLAVPSR